MKRKSLFSAKPAAAFALTTMATALGWAVYEEGPLPLKGDLDFLALYNIDVHTQDVFQDDSPVAWTGEGFHAGIQAFHFELKNCDPIPKPFDVELPDEFYCYFEISDMQGDSIGRQTEDLKGRLNILQWASSFKVSRQQLLGIARGGRYVFHAGIGPDLCDYHFEADVNDEPGIRVSDKKVTVGNELHPHLSISAGYPFAEDVVANPYSLHWDLTAASGGDGVIASGDETFQLKTESQYLAPIDSLRLYVDDELRPGKYTFTLTSDYAPANRSFAAEVTDTLRADVKFNLTRYDLKEDTGAKLTVQMDYGYPYVGLTPKMSEDEGNYDPTPMVIVQTTLLDEDPCETPFRNAAWENSPMELTANVEVPFSGLTSEIIEERKGEIPLKVDIKFGNGVTYFQKEYILLFEVPSETGVGIIGEEVAPEERLYTPMGLPAGENYHGIVITSRGRKIIK